MFPASDVVVAALDVPAMVGFFGVFGFAVADQDKDGAVLRTAGTDSGGIVIVHRPDPGVRRSPYAPGPAAIDIYTTDIAASVAHAANAGYEVGRVGDLSLGPVSLKQVRVHGPDHVPVVLVESSHRRSSIIDDDPTLLHSQGHSLVWVVGDRDAEAGWWVDHGASKGMDLSFAVPGVSDLLELPDSPVEVKMTMLSDEEVAPFRLELLEFAGRASVGSVDHSDRAGIIGLRFGESDAWDASPGGVRFSV